MTELTLNGHTVTTGDTVFARCIYTGAETTATITSISPDRSDTHFKTSDGMEFQVKHIPTGNLLAIPIPAPGVDKALRYFVYASRDFAEYGEHYENLGAALRELEDHIEPPENNPLVDANKPNYASIKKSAEKMRLHLDELLSWVKNKDISE